MDVTCSEGSNDNLLFMLMGVDLVVSRWYHVDVALYRWRSEALNYQNSTQHECDQSKDYDPEQPPKGNVIIQWSAARETPIACGLSFMAALPSRSHLSDLSPRRPKLSVHCLNSAHSSTLPLIDRLQRSNLDTSSLHRNSGEEWERLVRQTGREALFEH